MAAPKLDLTNPQDVVQEIFDDDRWVKDEFTKCVSPQILELAEVLALAFARFPKLDVLCKGGDKQAAFVAAFVYGIIDDLLTSAKLLVSGKLVASGNLMRQAIEGVAVALLCSARGLVHVRSGKQIVQIVYWKHAAAGKPLARSHLAVDQLEMNCDALRISRDAVAALRNARKRYHSFSHPGLMSLASRMSLGEVGPIYVGGSFDEAKLPAYRVELSERAGFCGTVPSLIDKLIDALA